ncbi:MULTISPECIES: hypothetical protein [unclassified Streptomyces]|uniref:hypothetical protein n=1 Tax=unclassified Streptomyces TaxID=2593676 RepID=UPI001F264CAF|nr:MULTISPECIES: hypothetical protein [unclassified Streptomyces]MCU4746511.1 hypothetical protein [Streptomyces sp. G-5]
MSRGAAKLHQQSAFGGRSVLGRRLGGRAAGQRRSGGAEYPLPAKRRGKLKALSEVIEALRIAINAKRRAQVRYLFDRADALIKALPADLTTEQREQLTRLRKKSTTSGKATSQSGKKPKPKPGARSGGKKPTAVSGQKPEPQAVPVRELGDRYISRAVLGYTPRDKREETARFS